MSLSKAAEEREGGERDRGFHHKRALAVNSRCLASAGENAAPPSEDHTQSVMPVAAGRGQHLADGMPRLQYEY